MSDCESAGTLSSGRVEDRPKSRPSLRWSDRVRRVVMQLMSYPLSVGYVLAAKGKLVRDQAVFNTAVSHQMLFHPARAQEASCGLVSPAQTRPLSNQSVVRTLRDVPQPSALLAHLRVFVLVCVLIIGFVSGCELDVQEGMPVPRSDSNDLSEYYLISMEEKGDWIEVVVKRDGVKSVGYSRLQIDCDRRWLKLLGYADGSASRIRDYAMAEWFIAAQGSSQADIVAAVCGQSDTQ